MRPPRGSPPRLSRTALAPQAQPIRSDREHECALPPLSAGRLMAGRRKRPPCGNPNCTDRNSDVRLQLIPSGFSRPVFEGATCFHRQRTACAEYFGIIDTQQPAAKRHAGPARIPVGAVVSEEPCPRRINEIDEIWGVRCASQRHTALSPHATIVTLELTAQSCHARRYCDIADMGPEQRGNALAEPRVTEYCTHGHFYRSPTDQKGVWGAWWIPVRKLVRRVGRAQVEAKIAEFEADLKGRQNGEMDAAEDGESSDEEAPAAVAHVEGV